MSSVRKNKESSRPATPAEYIYSGDDSQQQKMFKGIQRQLNFHNAFGKHQVIVEANPKIVSIGVQPQFTIMETTPLKKRHEFGKIDFTQGKVPKGKLN